jgi:hypothetical protein
VDEQDNRATQGLVLAQEYSIYRYFFLMLLAIFQERSYVCPCSFEAYTALRASWVFWQRLSAHRARDDSSLPTTILASTTERHVPQEVQEA